MHARSHVCRCVPCAAGSACRRSPTRRRGCSLSVASASSRSRRSSATSTQTTCGSPGSLSPTCVSSRGSFAWRGTRAARARSSAAARTDARWTSLALASVLPNWQARGALPAADGRRARDDCCAAQHVRGRPRRPRRQRHGRRRRLWHPGAGSGGPGRGAGHVRLHPGAQGAVYEGRRSAR